MTEKLDRDDEILTIVQEYFVSFVRHLKYDAKVNIAELQDALGNMSSMCMLNLIHYDVDQGEDITLEHINSRCLTLRSHVLNGLMHEDATSIVDIAPKNEMT